MALKIEIAESYRCCNSCNSNDEVINITALMPVGKTTQGTQIALCESCAQKLRFALNSRYGAFDDVRDN